MADTFSCERKGDDLIILDMVAEEDVSSPEEEDAALHRCRVAAGVSTQTRHPWMDSESEKVVTIGCGVKLDQPFQDFLLDFSACFKKDIFQLPSTDSISVCGITLTDPDIFGHNSR